MNSLDNFIITKLRNSSLPCLFAALLVIILASPQARSATDTWGGAGADVNWTTSGNWSDAANAAPSAFDSLDFTGFVGLTNTNNFTAGTAFDGITFDGGAGAFTLNGNGILLSGQIQAPSSAAAPGIINNSVNTQTINVPLTLDWGTYNIGSYSSGNLAIDNTLTPGAGSVILFGGTGAGATGVVTTTSLTVDPNTGLISGIEGAGLIQNSGTIGAMATLPLATIVGGNIVPLSSGSYVSVAAGEFSATTNATSNVLLTGNANNTTYFAQGLAAGENGMTYVNDIVEATGTGTIDVTGTLVFGAGASNSVGGLYLTGGTANQIMTFNASNGNAVTAGTTSAGGTLVLADNAIPGNTKNQLENNERIINNAAGGVVTVVKTGNGSMYFNNSGTGPNANSYTGGLYVDEGWLQGNAPGVFSTGPIYVASGASLYVETSQANNIFISPGSGNNGAQGFAPTNGPVGSIRFANFNALMTGSLTLQGAPVTAAPGDRISATQAGDTVTFANQVTGAGTLDMDTQASNTATSFAFDNTTANANNWTGGTIIENNSSTNKLMVEDLANNQFGANGGTSAGNMTFTQSGANTSGFLEFNLNGFSDTIGALISNGGGAVDTIVNNGAGSTTSTLTIGDNGGTGTFAGLIENTGVTSTLNIIKTGTGTQTFTANNTYSGATTVNNGVLVVTGTLLTSGNVTLDNTTVSGNPVLAGGGAVGNVTLPVNNGLDIATISPGASGTLGAIGKLTMTSLTLNGGQLLLDLSSTTTQGTTYDWINVTGAVTLPTSSAAWTVTPSVGAAAGVYTVLTGVSSNIGGGAALPTMNSPSNPLVRPTTYTPSFGSNSLLITVGGGAASIIWSGTNGSGGNGIWDVATTRNWNDSSSPSPTGQFFQGDAVTFDDSGINSNITIVSGTVGGSGYSNVLAGSVTVSSNTTNYTFSGQPIISAGGLAKSGSSTLTLNGSNSFGSVAINGGIVNAGNAGALGTAGNISFGGGALQYSASNQVDYSSRIVSSGGAIMIDTNGQNVNFGSAIAASNTGGLTKNGAGTLILANVGNAYTGNIVVNAGTLSSGTTTVTGNGNNGGTTDFGSIASTGRTITVNSGATLSFPINNVFGNGRGVNPATLPTIILNSGTLTTNNYVPIGALNLNGGTLMGTGTGNASFQSYQLLGTVTVGGSTASTITNTSAIAGVNLTGTTATFNVGQTGAVGGDLIVSTHLQNASNDFGLAVAGLTKTGLGTLVFEGTNNYTGTTNISNGIINYQNDQAFGGSSAIVVASGATAQVQGGITGGASAMSLAGTGATNATGALENVSGANSYAGTITLGANSTISSDAGSLTLSGGINDGGNSYALTTAGTGTITLSAASIYGGPTSVTAGTLNLTGSLNGSSSTTVTNARLEGTGLIVNGVTIGSGSGAADSAIIEPGAVGTVGTLTTGTVSILSDGLFVFNLDSTNGGAGNGSSELIAAAVSLNASSQFTFNDIAALQGSLAQGDVFTVISTPNGLTGTFGNLPNGDVFAVGPNQYQVNYGADNLTLTVIPEPATWGMMIAGMGMLVGIQRLRRRQTRTG